ncbi:lantibiotic dehydratase [Streptomyces harbinensis]|uniref:lantibiotic dehydratase n=1 Tax=Streptomyces harbinensis TaxID=1176198 RepID=UPI001590959C|nr:lantibiotic dehydratase [Streptomyces harbinensis]QKV71011.1 lantibiotic dehydratase [Streptomyces harbinensis]
MTLGRHFMLRLGGLPVESVRRLRAPGARAWADEVLERTARLAAEGERVGDLLHELVGRTGTADTDAAARRTLLRLRREVFNNRLPHAAGTGLALVEGLDPATGAALAGWLTARRELERRTAEGEDLLREETAAARAALRELAAEERLRAGLLLASPALDGQLDGHLRNPKDDKRARKIERSLLAYLYRTAAKTSPFATFTGVALGEFTGPAGGDGTDGTDRAAGTTGRVLDAAGPWRSHPRLNVLALGRVAEAIAADPARRADLPVTLASGWGREEDRVRYVRRWVTAGDDDTAVTFDTVKDRLFFLRRSGALERMLGLFERRPVLRHGELAAWLAEVSGAGPAEVDRYLGALLDVGMVQIPALRTQVHDTDPLRAFQDSLRTLGRPWADRVAAALDAPAAALDRYPHAAPAERRTLLAELRGQLAGLQRELGATTPRVPRTLLYEDALAPDVRTPRAAWERPVATGLRAVERVLPAFDLTLPQRITFQGFFLARYGRGGRCDDLLKLVHDFHEDFFDQYLSFTSRRTAFDEQGRYVPEPNWLGLPALTAVDAARRAFADGMRARWERHTTDSDTNTDTGKGPGAGDELVLDAALLDDVAAALAPAAPARPLYSHHVQLAGDLAVLNRSYGGLSFPFSRFTHCLGEATTAALRERTRALTPDGAVFAEVTGGPVTSNLNLHARLTDYEIVCPGETSGVPEADRLHLDDLYLEHDTAADRLALRSARLGGTEVIPVYLGYLVPLALPEIPRTLLLLSPSSMAPVDVWGGVPAAEPDEGVTRRPRVRHGDLVLARRSWSAPAAVLPLRAPGTAEPEWFLGWHRWRRRHRLPARVFVTVADSGARGATGAKPQYLDFDSPLSLAAFEALLKSPAARAVFREALPDEDAAHTRTERGTHVAELSVETF